MLLSRRRFLAAASAGTVAAVAGFSSFAEKKKALIAITLDLEMSAEYPRRGMTEWNYRKGELDADTKRYAVGAAKVAKERGGLIHFFALGRTLEQEDVGWLKDLAAAGHPIGNHTYDHVNLLAARAGGRPVPLQARPVAHSRQAHRRGHRGQHRHHHVRPSRNGAASRPAASARPAGSTTASRAATTSRRCS